MTEQNDLQSDTGQELTDEEMEAVAGGAAIAAIAVSAKHLAPPDPCSPALSAQLGQVSPGPCAPPDPCKPGALAGKTGGV
ncbi:MAG TPA: hypothetical protein VH062_22770 [Polyangiaceae bacterium]|jgi:hypothetical protein|nr:hypothetical protein [Polyangiaceae bacterium]